MCTENNFRCIIVITYIWGKTEREACVFIANNEKDTFGARLNTCNIYILDKRGMVAGGTSYFFFSSIIFFLLNLLVSLLLYIFPFPTLSLCV